MASDSGPDPRTLAYAALGGAAGFAAVYFGMPLLGAVEDGPTIRIATSVVAALFLAFCGAILGRAGAANARLRADFDDLPDAPAPDLGSFSTGTAVSDDELAQVVRETRAKALRERLTSVAAVGAAATVMFGLAALLGSFDVEFTGGLVVVLFALGIGAGVGVHKLFGPRGEDGGGLAAMDLGAAVEGGPSFDELLGGAVRLTVSRRSGLRSMLGREHVLTADDTGLATSRQELAFLRAILPSWLVPYRATISDGEKTLRIDKKLLSPVYRVSGAAGPEATIVRSFSGWRITGEGVALELREPLFFGKEVSILRAGERVGYAQIRAAGSLLTLFSGAELAIDVELPSDATRAERALLAAAFVVLDRKLR